MIGPNISILLPTRGRAEQLVNSVKSLFDLASGKFGIEILFGVDRDDDKNTGVFVSEISPYLDNKKISSKILVFEPMGYENLHHYVNTLAEHSQGQWLFFWNDDAVMKTQDWDKKIVEQTGNFKLLSVHTHNEHPYSIFPIVPRAWYDCLGYISQHSLNDAWVSSIAYMLDIFERIPVYADHNRHDLTGHNNDNTYSHRIVLEGNPSNPLDFNHDDYRRKRLDDAAKLATWMQDHGLDLSFFVRCCEGIQDPWEKLKINDVNHQITTDPGNHQVNSV